MDLTYKEIIESSMVLTAYSKTDFPVPNATEIQAQLIYAQLHMPYGTKTHSSDIVNSVANDKAVSIEDYLKESGVLSYEDQAPVISRAALFFELEGIFYTIHALHMHRSIVDNGKSFFDFIKRKPEHYELLVASDDAQLSIDMYSRLLTALDKHKMKIEPCEGTFRNKSYVQDFGIAHINLVKKNLN